MLTNSSVTKVAPSYPPDRICAGPVRVATLPLFDPRPSLGRGQHDAIGDSARPHHDRLLTDAIACAVGVTPSNLVKRHTAAWDGLAAEVVQATRRDSIEFHYRGPRHLLAVYEQGERVAGETLVEGLPRSALRVVKRKLTFVPAGNEFVERHEQRVLTRVTFFYIDPAKLPIDPDAGFPDTSLAPRLFFEDATLWETALKLVRLVESGGSDNQLYFEALGVVLAHELVRLSTGVRRNETPMRGGLAPWQQRIVTAYIEEHLAEQISLATLAALVRLSPFHFSRAFKQSFGVPPIRYHGNRRIEQAKILLTKPHPSVTDIGLTVGFSETSSFTSAFRKTTGLTPTAYHRSLA
jgi:AraC family transcriptional regulator